MFALLPLSLVLAAPVPKDARPLVNADPPKEWKLDELAAVVPGRDAGPLRVLAWHVIDTKRGFVIESALVVKELKKPTDAGEWFVLADVYRHPKDEKAKWRLNEISGTDVKPNGVPFTIFIDGYRYTTKAPTNDEIAELMKRMQWGSSLTPDGVLIPKLKAGGVVYANWKAALSREPPPELFPELKAK